MPPKQDTKKPKDSKPATTKGSGGGVKIVNLDDVWFWTSR